MNYTFIKIPAQGDKIFFKNSEINVPDHPVIPFIEGDGIGPDIWKATSRVIEEAVKNIMGLKKKYPGWRYSRAKRQKRCVMNGFPRKLLTLSGNIKLRSKDRSPLLWEEEFEV